MKKIPILLLLAVLLASCGASVSKDKESGTQEPPHTDISESQHESLSVITTTSETTTADTTTKPPDMDRPSPSQQMEADGISYTLFEEIVLVGIQSDMEKVTIAAQLTRTDSTGENAETINISKIYLCDPVFGISSVKELQLPRCRQLEIAEGYTQWEWTNDRVHAPQAQIGRAHV